MDAYRPIEPVPTAGHLTKLYSDAKKSAITSITLNAPYGAQQHTSQETAAWQRKFRIQKDRFVTWGLAWSDDANGPDGHIDESVAKAGLTETVESVLGNVKEVIDELERTWSGGAAKKAGEMFMPAPAFDQARYADLIKDLTDSVDTLYDLSRSRRALARGEHPTFSAGDDPELQASATKKAPPRQGPSKATSIAESDRTLVNPLPFLRPTLSPYAGLPPRIEAHALRLPAESPPPYESLGVPSAARQVGHLMRRRLSESVQNALGSSADEVPVLVEYANYDSIYRNTGVPPPLQRLEGLSAAFRPMRSESQHNISLLGYFEDPDEPRIGLVYDLPYSVQNRLHATAMREAETLTPMSLMSFIRKAKPSQASARTEEEPPSLETRFKLALRLVEQLEIMHSSAVRHGNINSSSVIFATTSSQSSANRQRQLRTPIWASFDVFSKCSVEGLRRPTSLNIYRHPDDNPQDAFRHEDEDARFDLYSLALVLLEIGLWTPLGDTYKAKYTLADFKVRVDKIWAPKLVFRCGSSYTRAVRTCLQAADSSGDASRMTIGAIYTAVLDSLRKCCMLDEDTEDSLGTLDGAPYLQELSTLSRRTTTSDLPAERPTAPAKTSSDPSILSLAKRGVPKRKPLSTVSSMASLPQLTPSSTVAGDSALSRAQVPTTRPEAQIAPRAFAPSFQDYKRKIVFLQQQWRERCERCRQRRVDREAAAAEAARAVVPAKPKLREYPLLHIPQSIREDWNNKTSLELANLVHKALQGSRESCSINLTSYGETPETARPTYLVTCASTKIVKQILKRHFRCDSKACYVRVEKGKITRCRKARRQSAAQTARSMAPRYEQDFDAINPDYQPQPVCGASIGAYKDEQHLPPVSFGGIVNINGRSYGMSVHHMLEAEEDDDEDFDEDDAGSDTSSLLSMDESSETDESDEGSTVRQMSAPSNLSLDEDLQTEGDAAGFMPGEGDEIEITQPALDDAISLNLHADEEEDSDGEDSGVDEDHILSYKLGQVHASSGLKRTSFHSTETGYRGISASLPQEIDWALFELLPPRMHPFNIVRGGSKFVENAKADEKDCYPLAVKHSSELAGATVHSLGRTSGLASGVISSTMELLKLHGRSTFSASWTVHGGFGVGGDSGAWVISSDGKVCGHVLAERAGRTYICPMDLLFEDIRETLGVSSVELPTVREQEERAAEENDAETQSRPTSKSGLEDVMARLRMEDSGGVPLPVSPKKAKRSRLQCESERFDQASQPLSSAG